MGNYDAWEVSVSSLKGLPAAEAVKLLPVFGVLAPSSHNSQPWKFQIDAYTIRILPDFSRRLSESDADDRQLYISLGCAAENMVIAGLAADLVAAVSVHQNQLGDFIEIRFENCSSASAGPAHLAEAIPKRLTNRSKYSDQLPPESFLNNITEITSLFCCQLQLAQEKETRMRLTDLVMKATDEAMASAAFRRELSQYLKPNTTSSPLGMPCFGMDIPTPISFIAPRLIKRFNLSKMTGKQERKLLEDHTPVLGLIFTDGDTPEEWILAGRAFQRIALEATADGLATNPLAALVQIGNYHQDLENLLGISGRLQVFFRLGYPLSAPPHSPRLPAEQVTVDL